MRKSAFLILTVFFTILFINVPGTAYAMHIIEGFLPARWSLFWSLLAFPFVAIGLNSINRRVKDNPSLKLLLGVAGAFAFVLSALKLPSITGSSSHPTGIGLGAVLFGPTAMTVIGVIVLLFQALLLAHGGITTLGANAFSMAVAGPFAAYAIFKATQKFGVPTWLAVFSAAFMGDIVTYVMTSVQLAIAFPAAEGGVAVSLAKFMGIFAVTQLPLAVVEGLLSVVVFNFLKSYNSEELKELSVITEEA